jgi:hypothetical protein|tara:strand:- start:151 stop:309 length:159 start_codon:yes stop_codon:yes gene_type:complete
MMHQYFIKDIGKMESFMSLKQSLLKERINRILILRGKKEQSLVVGKNKVELL